MKFINVSFGKILRWKYLKVAHFCLAKTVFLKSTFKKLCFEEPSEID